MSSDKAYRALHLKYCELKQRVTPMMEFKRREWVGLSDDERVRITDVCADDIDAMVIAEAALKEKNT